MKPLSFMFVAGEPSGDLLAAELVRAIRKVLLDKPRADSSDSQPLHGDLEPRFFGAGGPAMREAGVHTELDLTAHAVVGFTDVLRKILEFRRILHRLTTLAAARQPDALICVDFSGFNRRLAHAVRQRARQSPWVRNWRPLIVQYVSPQVWASREGRARKMAADYALLLAVFPFEKDWYAKRVPGFRVEYVGHPILDRHGRYEIDPCKPISIPPRIALLPGSRRSELQRHWPLIAKAFTIIRERFAGAQGILVLTNAEMASLVKSMGIPEGCVVQVGGLADVLQQSDVAIASTGTVTMECALFGVPTVALYKTSWTTYQLGKRLVRVPYLAMPNLLAGKVVFPEFIQDAASAENLSRAALELLENRDRRAETRAELGRIISTLGEPGASLRAARLIVSALGTFNRA